jgi:hypothetical protein
MPLASALGGLPEKGRATPAGPRTANHPQLF